MERITDELRDWVSNHYSGWSSKQAEGFAIADRIDANFKAACESEYAAGVMSVPIAVDESKWVKLPVDADGVPICVGDVVEYVDGTLPKEVFALVPPDIVMTDTGPRFAASCRHHHEATVEDVLAEFANRVCNSGHQWGLDAANTIAEYAKKLQLKEG